MITVTSIKRSDYAPWLLERHYARRMCQVDHAFGLFDNGALLGVITFGRPPNNQLNQVAGFACLELNRFCIDENACKNAASILIGRSLRMLPKPRVVISYADPDQGHVGYIYQATNWIYTGTGSSDIEFIKDGNQYHRKSLFNRFGTGSVEFLVSRGYRPVVVQGKHRYVYFVGSKSQRRSMRAALRYPVEPYPKGETRRYDASAPVQTQGVLSL